MTADPAATADYVSLIVAAREVLDAPCFTDRHALWLNRLAEAVEAAAAQIDRGAPS